MNSVANVKSGRVARAAGLVVPAVLLMLGTTGVVVKPTIGLEAARHLHREADAREVEFERETGRALQFERAGGTRLLEQAIAAGACAIPLQTTPLELHSVVTLTARHARLELATIEIGEPRGTVFESIDDSIRATPVEVKGRGALGDVVLFTEDLRAAGCAVSVDECSLVRIKPNDPTFDFKLSLSFHHRARQSDAGSATHRGDP